MAEPTYSGRKVVIVLGIIVAVVVTIALLMFFNGPRLDQLYKETPP